MKNYFLKPSIKIHGITPVDHKERKIEKRKKESKSAKYLTDNALPCEPDHETGAVVALQGRGEGAHDKLVAARLQNVG